MMKRNTTVLILVVGVFYAVLQFVFEKRNKSIEEQIQEAETGVATWKPEEVLKRLEAAEAQWQAATQALQAHDLTASFAAYHQARGTIDHYVEHYGDRQVQEGRTLQQWYDRWEEPYLAAVNGEFDRVLKRLETGDIPWPEVKQLIQNYDYLGFKDLKFRFDQVKPTVLEARARQAPNWIRFVFNPSAGDYTQVAREKLLAKYPPENGFKVVLGEALDDLERKATWKTVRVQIDQRDAQYQVQRPNAASRVSLPQVPESVEVKIRLSGTPSVPTSWDKLRSFRARVEVPETIWLKAKYRNGGAEAERTIEKARNDLIAALSRELEQVPRFQLYPDLDPARIQIREGNQLNLELARALGYLDKQRLLRELQALSQTTDPGLQGQIALLAVSLNLEPFAHWIAVQLPRLDSRQQRPVLAELQNKPWYGDYEPLRALLESPAARNNSGAILAIAHGQLQHAGLRQAVLKQIESAPANERLNFLSFYLREADSADVKPYATAWVTHGDKNFAMTAYNGLCNRHGDLATQLALEYFDQVPESIQERMLSSLGKTLDTPDERTYAILQKAARQPKHPGLRRRAIDTLMSHITTKSGWNILYALCQSEVIEASRRPSIQERLVYNIRQARPAVADEFLLQVVQSDTHNLRAAAIDQLLAGKQPKGPALETLAELVRRHPDDAALVKTVSFNVRRHCRRGDGWDLDLQQPQLEIILQAARNSADANVRRNAYKLMTYAVNTRHPQYAEPLRSALEEESSPKLRREFAKYAAVRKR